MDFRRLVMILLLTDCLLRLQMYFDILKQNENVLKLGNDIITFSNNLDLLLGLVDNIITNLQGFGNDFGYLLSR